jgi:hypothetical protein
MSDDITMSFLKSNGFETTDHQAGQFTVYNKNVEITPEANAKVSFDLWSG